jgi:hypothetical protein
MAFFVDLRRDYGYFISFLLQKGCHFLNENTSVGCVEIGISICDKEDGSHNKEARNPRKILIPLFLVYFMGSWVPNKEIPNKETRNAGKNKKTN